MPSIIAQELIEIWKQLLGGLQQDIWYIIDDSEEFLPSLQMAISLNALEYETLLLSSGITFKRGNIILFSKAKLDYLQAALTARPGTPWAFFINRIKPASNALVKSKVKSQNP